MNSYPADAARIRDVERGLSCVAVVPSPAEGTLSAGDSVVFALADSRPGEEPCYTKGGDSIRVLLTGVADLGEVDPRTGRTLVRLAWNPPGGS
jgi:hypothetical protein